MPAAWSLAIDFGTSNTTAAVETAGRIETVRLDAASDSMPSAVLKDGDALIVGRAAENRMRTSPADYEPAPKTLLGRSRAVLGGGVVDPIDLAAAVL
ncbi:MAG: hypothetical protein J7480_10330, partial [Microbacteriaceae bacterium]|nr:hypothetical protein [Microbacteriaceae bacterium]